MNARLIRLRSEIVVERYGWGPLLLLLLLAATGLLQGGWVRQAAETVRELQHEVQTLAPAQQPSSPRLETEPSGPADTAPHEFFPNTESINLLVVDVFKAAEAHGLQLEQSGYQYGKVEGLPWTKVEISVPVTGRYPAIRQFAETVLRDHPHVALDQLSFKREAASAAHVEVVVRFSAWFTDPNGGNEARP